MKVGQVCVLAVGRRMPLAAEEAEGPGVGDVAGIALPLLICIAVTCADSRPPRAALESVLSQCAYCVLGQVAAPGEPSEPTNWRAARRGCS